MERNSGFKLGVNGIMGLVMLILAFVALYYVATGIFTLLGYAAPLLLLGALVVNWRTVAGYGKFVLGLFTSKRWVMGIVAVILTVIGFPVVSGFLFAKSFIDRKVAGLREAHREQTEGVFVEYEDVTEEAEIEDVLELPVIEEEIIPEIDNEYDDLFDETNR